MPKVRITRRLHFSAAHRLARADLSDDENRRIFGDCANPNWHGHNYELEVTVAGPVDPETGYVMDLKDLKDLVNGRVVDDLDHRNLNLDVPWLKGVMPTTENLVVSIWERLAAHIPEPAALERVVLWETPRHWVEYGGE
ncbi:MAG: 6-carboxytetrahydropterin synthase [Gemmatimonadetes bacterium]|nr:6-carboxytetrahydropterin synthase [Gemmatimonadota bacterium]MDE2676558.1 6-carboxytetrahydropterin synthase [Gemmatimonadota bacterium]MXX35825.1 6-carboxytetrahydropterin synthase [Gemmatimonadota bacterium]MYA13005.1 6-carboxytetrahydropterin synthase [Gemmatimonadota bacterium]MYD12406.1 6-carboxytetrahydropterin synthase [Gemmatimonadota bacterium]